MVELPYWLAAPLFQRGIVDVSIPKFYGQKVREDLMMDAKVRSLYDLCPYFYRFSAKLMSIIRGDDHSSISKTILRVVAHRPFAPREYHRP